MNRAIQKVLLLLAVVPASLTSQAQQLTGIWRGYFITETGDEYRLEFQVQQARSRSVTGVSYSYLDKRFYGKASMTGNFALQNSTFQIQETRTTEVRNLGGGGTCLMNYKFSYSKSGKEEFLEGTYVGKSEDRVNPKNNGVWGDCGGGKVYLRRVENSDFYVEPFLRENVTRRTTSSRIPKPVTQKPAPPVAGKVAKQPPAVVKKTPPFVKTDVPPVKEKATTVRPSPPPVTKVEKVFIPRKIDLPLQTRSRQNELVKTLDVSSPTITIRLYDNGEIDDDTISVYLDNKIVLSQKRLTTSPVSLTIEMNEEHPEHVLVMVAENLGRIPPNTSLMIVADGDKRYEVRITSTEQKNAMVRFRYTKGSSIDRSSN